MYSVRAYVVYFLICSFVSTAHCRNYIMEARNVTRGKKTLLDLTQRVLNHGYIASEHIVETEDGYLLTVFRMQRPGVKGSPVLVMHGLLQSGMMWIDTGPGVALGYLLADGGHDVWLGNVRGTHYSRRHAWLNPNTDSQYWKFCVDEIGRYDHPAVIDYILSQTGAPKLNYIGFSQGGGTFFIMCSERPEYCDKVRVMIALAPATRHLFTKSEIFNTMVQFYERNEYELSNTGVWEVFPKGGLLQSFLEIFCSLSDTTTKICSSALDAFDAPNPGSKIESTLRAISASFPAGTSVHNMARYGQSTKTKHFQKYDFGPEGNFMHYGRATPPIYELNSASVPTVVIYGRNDGIVDRRDIKWLLRKLPNVVEAYEVKDVFWTHMDFPYSKNLPHLLYPKIEEYL